MKVNIIIDSNLLFNRYAFYLSHHKGYYLDKRFQQLELIKYAHRSIEFFLNGIDRNAINSIHFTFDQGKSWRTELFPENTSQYKHGRDKDSFDYQSFNKVINDYADIMQQAGMYVHKMDMLEADDIIGHIVKYFKNRNMSTIIMTSDSDLRQLISSDKDKFCCIYDSDYQKQLYYIDNKQHFEIAKVEFDEDDDEDDFAAFFDEKEESHMSDTITFDIRECILSKYEEIDSMKGLLVKIFSGDKTDNIPSSFIKITDKEKGTGVSFGKTNAENLYEQLKRSDDIPTIFQLYTMENKRRDIAAKILSLAKSKDLTQLDVIEKNLIRNIHLIYLDSDFQKDFNLQPKYDIIDKKLNDSEIFDNHKRKLKELKFSKEYLRNTDYYYDDATYFRNV